MVDLARLAPGPIGPLAGMEYVRQRGMEGQQRGQQNALSRLAGQAYTAPQADRQAIFGQMAQVDPQAALEAEQTFAKRDDDAIGRIAAKARYVVGLHKAGQGAAAAPAYASLVQDARALNLGDIPEKWDDSFIPGLEQLASYGVKPGDDNTPSDIRSLQILQSNPELLTLDRERRQAAGMIPKMVETSQGIGWGTPGGGIQLAPLVGVAGQGQGAPQAAPQLFAALGQKYGIAPTSVRRSPQRNADVGGVSNSFHLSGQAADWVVPQQLKASFIADAQANGFEAIDEGDHIHIEPAGQRPTRQPVVFDPINGGIAQPHTAAKAPTEFDRRIETARALGASDDEIRRMVIGREGAAAGAKPLPAAVLKLREETIAEAETARTINNSLDRHLAMIEGGKLSFGPAQNLIAQARNAAGASTEETRNFAEFRSDLEKLRNDSLRLNAGVQTDGDAQRAWNELFANLNDTNYVKQRLQTIRRLNERAETLKRASVERIDAEYGRSQPEAPAQAGNGDFSALWN